MEGSNRDAGPGFFQGASYIDAKNSTFNRAGRDQYIYNSMNNEMVVRPSIHWISSINVELCAHLTG
jgi:hypothetical protein